MGMVASPTARPRDSGNQPPTSKPTGNVPDIATPGPISSPNATKNTATCDDTASKA